MSRGRGMGVVGLLASIAGCGFSHGTLATSGDSSVPGDAVEVRTWSFDTAADFARPGSRAISTGVEPWGSVTPAAYVPGGVIVRGKNQAFWDFAMTDGQLSWSAVEGVVPDGIGFWRVTPLDDTQVVRQFGIVDPTMPMSLWIEGEVLLDDPGDHVFWLDADGVAFLEVARPDSDEFVRVVASRVSDGAGTTGMYAATSAGWHPFRIGFGQTSGAMRLAMQVQAPAGVARGAIHRTHLRARAEGLRGVQRTAFDHQLLTDAREIMGLETGDMLPLTTFPTLPPGVTSVAGWSGRWTGQFYAVLAGPYTFTVSSDDGNHVVTPSGGPATAWGYNLGTGNAVTNATANLRAGWNQLVVDYNQVSTSMRLDVRITGAPEAALVGNPVPGARLRPVETQLARAIVQGRQAINATIVDDTSAAGSRASADFAIRGFSGEIAGVIDVVVRANAPDWQDLNIELVRPDGQTLQLCNNDCPSGGDGDRTVGFETTSASIIGGSTNGTWRVRVWDDQSGGGGNGTLIDAYLTVRCSGGLPTIATDARWQSEVHDLGEGAGLVDVTSVAWTARTPRGAGDVEVYVRGCPDATCAGVEWSPPVASGAGPSVPAGVRYLQTAVRLLSDGLHEPELEQLTISYRAVR